MKRHLFQVLICMASAAAAVGLMVFLLGSGGDFDAGEAEAPQAQRTITEAKPVGKSLNEPERDLRSVVKECKTERRIAHETQSKPLSADEVSLTVDEEKLMVAFQDALDKEDFKATVSLLAEAMASKNPAVRSQAVTSLRWFGKQALPELTTFMADGDEDVRSDAVDAFTMALTEVESDAEKGKIVQSAMTVLQNEDQLSTIVMELNGLPEVDQVNLLLPLVDGNNMTAAKVAREHYEFVTGEVYTTAEAAQKWCTNAALVDL